MSCAVGANDLLRLVDPRSATGPPWRGKFATDQFHQNDVGHRDRAAAFVIALG